MYAAVCLNCFHSIGFPSEWGHEIAIVQEIKAAGVSIQLGSPASGDLAEYTTFEGQVFVSIQLGSPASGDLFLTNSFAAFMNLRVSIQLGSPASGDVSEPTEYIV